MDAENIYGYIPTISSDGFVSCKFITVSILFIVFIYYYLRLFVFFFIDRRTYKQIKIKSNQRSSIS